MSTKPETIEVFVTTCDRPRCGKECGRSPAASKKKQQPAFFLQRLGKPDILYNDLCPFCVNATNNYCDGIEKVIKEKADPDLEPDTGEPDTDEAGGAGVEPAVGGGAP